jgi:thioredoxin-related protein
MRRVIAGTALLLITIAAGCSRESVWYSGDLTAAKSAAKARETMVMVGFFTDWCTWCERMAQETFTDPRVREELARLVPMWLDAEGEGLDLATRFEVTTYPTLVFLDSRGREIERLCGYLPPDKLLEQLERIWSLDSFSASLDRLAADPEDIEALRRSVRGFLHRSDPLGAIQRIEAFQQASDAAAPGVADALLFQARAALHERLYANAAKLYRKAWKHELEVPPGVVGAELASAVEGGIAGLERGDQREALRLARQEDAKRLLAELPAGRIEPGELFSAAQFAFDNGQYTAAADLYRRWYNAVGTEPEPRDLNRAAWHLYLSRTELASALAMARRARDASDSPHIADTLGRLLYLTGSTKEAIATQTEALGGVTGARAERYREVLRRMKAGEELVDRPGFEEYPE